MSLVDHTQNKKNNYYYYYYYYYCADLFSAHLTSKLQ